MIKRLFATGKIAALLALSCLLVQGAGASLAQTVLLNLGDGVHGRAQYHAGRSDRPVVLFVHDFLAAPSAPVVDALARRLDRDGVALLVPTLSLGIVARRDPLACEAIHTHIFEQDLVELRQWVDWLLGKGRTRIVLVGLRYGGWQAVALAGQLLSPAVQAVIMISPQTPPPSDADLPALRSAAAAGARDLMRQPVWHCPSYVGPADSIYSYVNWDAAKLMQAVKRSTVAVRAIVGGRDKRLDAGWRTRLDEAGALVQLVPDATSFRDPRHLGSLLELIVASLIIEG
ncbi:MAG: hypothetical protein OET44_09980 [Gammaproteobacteria bacterium]|nr:hypothetical protein [Gammaproteobacteria bacterium]